MSIQLFSQQFFGIKKEVVRNTAELVPNLILPVDTNTIQAQTEHTLDEIAYSNRDNNYDEYLNKLHVEGEITGHINNRDVGALIYYATGQVTSNQIATTGAYIHEFAPRDDDTQLPTFTAFYADGAKGVYKASGCAISELTLEFGENESKFTATVLGLVETKVTDGTELTNINTAVVYTAPVAKYTFGSLVATFNTTISALGAITNGTPATGTNLKLKPGLTLTINNNVELDLSSTTTNKVAILPIDTIAQKFQTSLSATGYVRDDVAYNWPRNNTKVATEFLLLNPSAPNIGTGTVKPELRIRLGASNINVEIDRPLNEGLTYNLELENAINNVADGQSAFLRVINGVVSY
jgi:hypothetical protein